jgi:ATP-dependent Clp protease protease subunit
VSTQPTSDRLLIGFFCGVSPKTVHALLEAVTGKLGGRELVVLISCSGGNTEAALLGYNFLKSLGVPVTTVNMGVVASNGVTLFCAGSRRIAMPRSRFLFHPLVFKLNESLNIGGVHEKLGVIETETRIIADLLVDAGVDRRRAVKLVADHASLDAEEAMKEGVVHTVEVFEIRPGEELRIIRDE